jgi:hypothetical protein
MPTLNQSMISRWLLCLLRDKVKITFTLRKKVQNLKIKLYLFPLVRVRPVPKWKSFFYPYLLRCVGNTCHPLSFTRSLSWVKCSGLTPKLSLASYFFVFWSGSFFRNCAQDLMLLLCGVVAKTIRTLAKFWNLNQSIFCPLPFAIRVDQSNA